MLVEKHIRLQTEARRAVEEQADSVLASDNVVQLRDEIAELMVRYDEQCENNSALKWVCGHPPAWG